MSQKNKILKVIYYDENAAMDYVTIMNDGNITIEEINKAIEGYDSGDICKWRIINQIFIFKNA